ncbi:MAG: amidohydrolase family protein, partial [Woeseiaceae bacterium]
MKTSLITSSLLILSLAACGGPADEPASPAQPVAQTIYLNGAVITMNDAQPTAEAVAAADGRIIAVGSASAVAKYRGEATDDVDLAGRTLSPGFIDGHAHLAQFGLQAVGANLLAEPDGEVGTIDELVAKLQEFATTDDVNRAGWIFGVGYDDAILAQGRHPTRDDLDRVSTELPVMATHISGHFAAVNSKGLEIIGYTAQTPDPEGGIIRRRPGSQEPNGVLEELAAIPMMLKMLSPRTPEDQRYYMQKGLEAAMSFGYTTAQEGRAFANTHAAMAGYAATMGFPIDIVSYIDYSDTVPLESDWYGQDYRRGYRVGGLKITLDGSPQGRTAWRTEPYLLPPDGQDAGYLGYPAIPDDEVVIGLLDNAYEKNWQVLMHANGDAAIDQMLLAVGAAHD